jgi:hypothetical protein
MARLIYTVIMSLDGYTADKNGNFDWAEPDEEVHSFINELERPVGTYLYGRRMYEVMWSHLASRSATPREMAPGLSEVKCQMQTAAELPKVGVRIRPFASTAIGGCKARINLLKVVRGESRFRPVQWVYRLPICR